MSYEPKPGDGALFQNEHRTADKHPNATGYVIAHRNIRAGEKLRLASWTKSTDRGKFMSLKLSDERERKPNPDPAANDRDLDFDDDIPF